MRLRLLELCDVSFKFTSLLDDFFLFFVFLFLSHFASTLISPCNFNALDEECIISHTSFFFFKKKDFLLHKEIYLPHPSLQHSFQNHSVKNTVIQDWLQCHQLPLLFMYLGHLLLLVLYHAINVIKGLIQGPRRLVPLKRFSQSQHTFELQHTDISKEY